MKTPEELAKEYRFGEFPDTNSDTFLAAVSAYKAFLAGYKAAQDRLADTSKVMFCVYCNDTHKGDCAPGKGKNHPALNAKWISVKDRLPEEGEDCIFYVDFVDKWDSGSERINFQEIGKFNGKDCFYHRSHTDLNRVTHWMPLPKPPKEEK